MELGRVMGVRYSSAMYTSDLLLNRAAALEALEHQPEDRKSHHHGYTDKDSGHWFS